MTTAYVNLLYNYRRLLKPNAFKYSTFTKYPRSRQDLAYTDYPLQKDKTFPGYDTNESFDLASEEYVFIAIILSSTLIWSVTTC